MTGHCGSIFDNSLFERRNELAELMNVIKGRRSIRRYEEKEVSEAVLNQLFEALKWTPSWANTQCWELIVVKSQETKHKLQETISKGNPATKALVNAPVVLALGGQLERSGYYHGQVTTKFGDWLMFDLGLATQNLCLAAHNLGLGTVIVGLFDHDKAKEVLAVPPGYELVVLIPLGYPAKEPGAPKRREPHEFVHFDKF
jgi:nitroreductase